VKTYSLLINVYIISNFSLQNFFFFFFFPFILLSGILRSTDIADDNSFVYWDKQGWRLLCTTECIFVYVHWPNHHMGSAQLLCITSHCIPQRNFRMVAGVLFNHLFFFFDNILFNHPLPEYIYIYIWVCVC
jgi:hypothetical protein